MLPTALQRVIDWTLDFAMMRVGLHLFKLAPDSGNLFALSWIRRFAQTHAGVRQVRQDPSPPAATAPISSPSQRQRLGVWPKGPAYQTSLGPDQVLGAHRRPTPPGSTASALTHDEDSIRGNTGEGNGKKRSRLIG